MGTNMKARERVKEIERERKGDDIPHMRSKACVQVFLAHVLCVSLCVSKLFKNSGVSVCAFGVERFSAFIDANRGFRRGRREKERAVSIQKNT